ncbi:MAG: flagellar filament capping protein FliD [Peptostreptococcaceae bacterium]|jgi:flagellar hook-associated protein 2|nr:flagellar filament capping protein FliD [Peptostreptococcaceae bacterium]
MSGIRFSGLASGMDTENMVKELMKAERFKVDKYEQKKTLFEWKTSAYTDMNKSIASFVIESRKSLGIEVDYFGNITPNSVNKMDWVKSTSSSDSSIAEISSNTEALDGTNSINITKLASGVFSGSQKTIAADQDLFATKVAGDTVTVTINGENLSLDGDATISDLVSAINNNDNLKGELNASYDSANEKFFLSTKGTGSAKSIQVGGDAEVDAVFFGAGSLLHMNTTDATTTDDMVKDTAVNGQDLELTFNGIAMTNDKNEMTVNNITINAKSIGTVTATTSTDTDAVIDKVNEFVENYNAFIDIVNGKLSEKQYRDYDPLSSEQKEAMKEDDIKLWEGKAKSGLLRNDDYLSSMLRNTRSWIYAEVEGVDDKYNQIAEIGITTTSNYKDNGKLEVDEDKLRAALQDDPTAVMDMLFKSSGSTKKESEMTRVELEDKRNNTGFFGRIYDEFASGMQGMIEKAGTSGNDSLYRKVKSNILMDFVTSGSESMIGKQLATLNKTIDDENARLLEVENRYWAQFGAMEKAINEMNQQSGWIGQQMGM